MKSSKYRETGQKTYTVRHIIELQERLIYVKSKMMLRWEPVKDDKGDKYPKAHRADRVG